MRRFIQALIGALLLIGWYLPASGADLPVKAAPVPYVTGYTWSGLYLEGFGMWGADIKNAQFSNGITSADLAGIPNGPGLGGAIGYNIQTGKGALVIGARIESSWVNFKGGGTNGTINALQFSSASNYLGAANVVIGIPISPDDRLLAYLTGGFAWGGNNPSLVLNNGAAGAVSATSTGYDLGGGLAFMFTPSLFGFLEIDWYKLGDKSVTVLGTATATAPVSDVVQKVGVGFKF
jgi:outer membrane immunogenic protein